MGPRFIFRQPSLSSVTNIYILPFSVAVWSTYALTTIVLTVFLFVTQRLERRIKKCQATVPPENWSGALLTSVGIICQQGCPTTPGNVSSRIIFLFLFLLSIFFFTSYSAIIVSLLQTPSSTINTLKALLRSPLKIVVNDINYNFNYDNYVNESASALVKELFHERILSQPKQDVYLTMEHGVELIRTGMFAFHVDMGAYKIIGDTWHDSEKCNLKEVFMFPAYKGAIPVQKGSPYRDHISRRLRWLREVGMINREWKRWVTEKPRCDTHYSGFISVGIEDFYPALLVLTYGIPCSLVACNDISLKNIRAAS
uniref:Ionotropic glutamate receptor C-terminal domain-containing protein n=1 Tax=Timema shepardi TaxID=629360 RepID=A0A7R9G5T4_TIMSH|nr:unnamed protein product [Timema shepardi]